MNKEGISCISMESLSPFDSIHSYRSDVPVENLSERDYRWLAECVDYEDRYMII